MLADFSSFIYASALFYDSRVLSLSFVYLPAPGTSLGHQEWRMTPDSKSPPHGSQAWMPG